MDAALRGMRSQSAPNVNEEHANRTRRDKIIAEIKALRDSYGQKGARSARPIPFSIIDAFFDKVAYWAREERETDASERIETAVKEIEKTAEKLEKRWKETGTSANYAQVLSRGTAGGAHGAQRGWDQAPTANPQEERIVYMTAPPPDACLIPRM